MRPFEDLEAWRKARVFATTVYKLSHDGSFAKDVSLHQTINAATGTVMDCIAESFEQNSQDVSGRSLAAAIAAAQAIRSQLYRALDRHHISEIVFQELFAEVTMISKLIIKRAGTSKSH